MRKYIIHLATAAIALVGFVACDVETNEKPGGTAVEQMAGFWDVRVHRSERRWYAYAERFRKSYL